MPMASAGHPLFTPAQPSSPVNARPAVPASDFALIFEYGACGTDRLDTFRGDFTKDRLVESAVTIPITVTLSDKISIYQKIIAIDFFSYPSHYEIPVALAGSVTAIEPANHYLFIVRNEGQTKAVEWLDNIVEPKTAEADRLRELASLLMEMIDAKPEVKRLPAPNGGCI